MRQRDAEQAAKRFVRERFADVAHWHFDICEEGFREHGRKSWSFGLKPDEEDDDYEPGRYMTGYVHANGYVEGLY